MMNWDERSSYVQSTFAAGCDSQTSKKARTEEPQGEDVPGASGEDPLEQPTCALNGRGDKERKENGGGPRPGPFQEDDVEGATLGRQGVRGGEGVGLGSEERVGRVEVGGVLQRIVGAVADSQRCKDER